MKASDITNSDALNRMIDTWNLLTMNVYNDSIEKIPQFVRDQFDWIFNNCKVPQISYDTIDNMIEIVESRLHQWHHDSSIPKAFTSLGMGFRIMKSVNKLGLKFRDR
jgi:hypothetical protein